MKNGGMSEFPIQKIYCEEKMQKLLCFPLFLKLLVLAYFWMHFCFFLKTGICDFFPFETNFFIESRAVLGT